MKTTRILLICIVLMGLQSLSANIADDWRISKVTSESRDSFAGVEDSWYTSWENFYNHNAPLVVDHCSYHYHYVRTLDGEPAVVDDNTEDIVAACSFVQDNGDTYTISAPISNVFHNPVTKRYRVTTKSSNGDILRVLTYDMTTGNLIGRIIYEYDTQAKLLAVYGLDLSNSSYSKVIYSYDELGRLIIKTSYTSPDSLDWLPQQKEEFQYSGLTIPDNLCINEFKRYLNNDIPVFSHYQISDYKCYTWQEDHWSCNKQLYPDYVTNESGLTLVFIDVIGSSGEGGIDYRFNNLGQLLRYATWSFGGVSSGQKTVTYTWSTWGLPNEDPTATPETPIQIEAYPNPFAKNISISSSRSNDVLQDIRVYNLKGQLIKQLPTSKDNNATWDGTDSSGHSVANGVYFVRVKAGEKSLSKKIVLTK